MISDVLRQRRGEREVVTREHFARWRRDPITQELYMQLVDAFLEALNENLPDTMEGAAAVSLRREGGLAMIEEVFDFRPKKLEASDEAQEDE